MFRKTSLLVISLVGLLEFSHGAAVPVTCKATPGTANWPSEADWSSLNQTLDGALLQPPPPGGVCYEGQPNFNNDSCPVLQRDWNSWSYAIENPLAVGYNNWNNDSCLPYPTYPCSGDGYPVYSINASTAEHVQAGINFAREKNIRLVVKATGHDFRGRSTAANSLSIWVRHLKGITFHESFTPEGKCQSFGPALTYAAGETSGTAFAEADRHGYMISAGGAASVGPGGFISGGGHTLISHAYGLAADNVLEAEVVTPNGEIVIANDCQNQDLFWALRGGGGPSFGVVLNWTVKAYKSESLTEYLLTIASPPNASTAFWDAFAYIAGQYPFIADNRVMSYTFITAPNETAQIGWVYTSQFVGLNMTAEQTTGVVNSLVEWMNITYGNDLKIEKTVEEHGKLYDYWQANPDAVIEGVDVVMGSRILDAKALNSPDFKELMQAGVSQIGMQLYLVSGPGTHSKPADFNALHPAWRTGYVHALTSGGWFPINSTLEAYVIDQITNNHTAALRQLAPDTGSYLNEANAYEPDFQQAFWGSNYDRLLKIKRELDPTDLFWCLGCAGSERWAVQGNRLCQI